MSEEPGCPDLRQRVRILGAEILDRTSYEAAVDNIDKLPCSALELVRKSYEAVLEQKEESRRQAAIYHPGPKVPLFGDSAKPTFSTIRRKMGMRSD